MKRFPMALAAILMLAGSMPASAQSANDAIRYDQARDPGYQSAVRSNYGGYGSSGVGYVSTRGHKPRNGELRTLADGTAVSYDKRSHRWVVVHQPAAQPRGVYVDRDTYVAR